MSYHRINLRCEASRVIRWNKLIHKMGYCTPDQVTIIIMYLYHLEDKSDLLD